MADDLRVRAHLLLGPDAQHAEGAVVEHAQRLDGGVLLQRLRGQVEEFLARAQRLTESGVDRGNGLADSGGRRHQQRLALRHRAAHRIDHLRLKRANALVGEGQAVGEGAFGHQENVRRLHLVDPALHRRGERAGDGFAIEFGIDDFGVSADQVDEDELGREGEPVEVRLSRQEQRIEHELEQMALQFLRPVESFELQIEVDRFHFLDDDPLRSLVHRQAINAPGDGDRPSADLQAVDDVHF